MTTRFNQFDEHYLKRVEELRARKLFFVAKSVEPPPPWWERLGKVV